MVVTQTAPLKPGAEKRGDAGLYFHHGAARLTTRGARGPELGL